MPSTGVNYQYDGRGKLSKIVDPVAGTWTFEYDAAGRPVRRMDPDGVERRVTYTPQGFVNWVNVETPLGANDYADYGYAREPLRPGGVAVYVLSSAADRALSSRQLRSVWLEQGGGAALVNLLLAPGGSPRAK
jgi:hypothetical protein